MTLIGIMTLAFVVALCGFLVYALTTYVPMPPLFAQVIQVGAAFLLFLYFLAVLAGHAPMPTLPVFR